MADSTKDYNKMHTVQYKGQWYIFNPETQVTGRWHIMSKFGTPHTIAKSELQPILNKLVFNSAEIPSIEERLRNASPKERDRLMKESLAWLKLKVAALKSNGRVPNTTKHGNKDFSIGKMYFFAYDAKHKDTLPYWDAFPLIILIDGPIGKTKTHFMGLNLHYLPIELRAILLSKLISSNGVLTKDGFVKYLKNLTYSGNIKKKIPEAMPCIKMYIASNLRSRILPIEPHEWMFAITLPYQDFQKQKASSVWKDSQEKIDK